MAKRQHEYQAELRRRRLDAGLCVACGAANQNGRNRCDACRAKQSSREKAARLRTIAAGLCVYCGVSEAKNGVLVCGPCSERRAKLQLGHRAKNVIRARTEEAAWARMRRHRLRDDGLCAGCSKPSSAYLCGPCREGQRARGAAYKARKKAKTEATGTCTSCGNAARADGRKYCLPCLEIAQLRRYTRFGLTIESMKALGSKCCICGERGSMDKKGGRLHIDHCHGQGVVRGLLCKPCNTGLGAFRDKPSLLMSAIKYLLEHQKSSITLPPVDASTGNRSQHVSH